MAVEKRLLKSDVLVTLYTGNDTITGNPIYKSSNLNGVDIDVSPDVAVYSVDVLMGLQQHSVYEIQQRDTSDLFGEPEVPGE